MRFTNYGHACFMIETAGKKLLFDPFVTGNDNAKHIDINSIQADYILLSHGHGDHIADLVPIAKNTGATVIAMAEIATWAKAHGVENVHPMNYGPKTFDFGKVRMVPAAHSSSLPDGTYGGNPGGYIVTTEDGSFYYTGDTCLTSDLKLVPHYGTLDFAVMPIGGNYTMDPDDAIMASDFIQCNRVVGVHYNTWPIIGIDADKAQADFKAAGKELHLPAIGETIELK